MHKTAIVLLAAFAAFAAAARAVTIDWVQVGSPGNAADPIDGDPFTPGIQNFGAVSYAYSIDKYDVTNSQYAKFLNAKDPTGADPRPLPPDLIALLGTASERALDMTFADFRSQVLPFLEEPHRALHATAASWDRLREDLIERIEALRR